MKSLGTNVGEVFRWNGLQCDPERVNLVFEIVWTRLVQLERGEHTSDDIMLFIKDEPHKQAKLDEGRLRLISGVSLLDTLIDRLIFTPLVSQIIPSFGRTPSMIGWSPTDGGHRYMYAAFPTGAVSFDKSAWDWSVPDWLIDLWVSFLEEMFYGYPSWYIRLIKLRCMLLFEEPVFRSKLGTREAQGFKGAMKSGCFLTIALNTLGQSMVHYVVNLMLGKDPTENQPFALGDDTIQPDFDYVEEYKEGIASLGFTPKYQRTERFVEFCGFLMNKDLVIPAYWRKHLFCLKYLDEETSLEMLDSYQQLYFLEPVLLRIVQKEISVRDPTLLASPRLLALWRRGYHGRHAR